MKNIVSLLLLLALGGVGAQSVAPTAPASVPDAGQYRTLDLGARVAASSVIVRGVLGQSKIIEEKGEQWRVYPLRVLEAIAGDPARLPQRQLSEGGERETVLLLWQPVAASFAEQLPSGPELILFLHTAHMDAPFVGGKSGIQAVDKLPAGQSLDDYRRSLLQERSNP